MYFCNRNIYITAVDEAKKRINELFRKNVLFEKDNIGSEEVIKGIALHAADKIFSL